MTETLDKDLLQVYQEAEASKEEDLAKFKEVIDQRKKEVFLALVGIQSVTHTDWLPMLSFNILIKTRLVSHIPVPARFGAIVYNNEGKPMLAHGTEPMLFPTALTHENLKSYYRHLGMSARELEQFDRYELVNVHLELNNTNHNHDHI
jgi:hypothetical protein